MAYIQDTNLTNISTLPCSFRFSGRGQESNLRFDNLHFVWYLICLCCVYPFRKDGVPLIHLFWLKRLVVKLGLLFVLQCSGPGRTRTAVLQVINNKITCVSICTVEFRFNFKDWELRADRLSTSTTYFYNYPKVGKRMFSGPSIPRLIMTFHLMT